jgi:HD-GYP domain-containing protein (c-di-GMP phosphodiesterase class II)/HAMP domain-containing protein
VSAPRLRLDVNALRSKVARRIFLAFAACSMLPLSAFAIFAFWQVRSQLEADAVAALRHASKAAGMSIVERLMIADEELKVILEARYRSGAAGAPERPSPVGGGRIRSIDAWPRELADARLTAEQRARLDSGSSVLLATPQHASSTRIELLRLGEPAGAGRVWVAELEPEFVFVPRRRNANDHYWIENERGQVLFESSPGAARGPRLPATSAGEGQESFFHREGAEGEEIGASWSLFLRTRFLSPSWTIAFSRPRSEVHRPLHRFEATFPLLAIAVLGVALVLGLAQVRRSFVPIDQLIDATRQLSGGDLDARVAIHTNDEFEDLGRSFNRMAAEIGHQIRILSAVNGVGKALSAELDTRSLLDLILRESMRATDSAGAALFLALDGAPLELARLLLAGRQGGKLERAIALDPVLARRAMSRAATWSAAGVAELPELEQDAWRAAEAELGVSVGPQVSVPLRDGRGSEMGVLILFRESGADGYGDESCELAESLASQAATAIIKNHMVDSFRSLFEGVIQLTVRAIDEKSSYTGDHCRNVPILTEMIADAACAATRGPLKDFALSPDERYELRIAALLHDCGKVATPVHVMDKATKLETIFDRIELVDTRFEIVRRDIEANAAYEAPEEIERRLDQLEDDRRFVHASNRGGEAMPDEAVRRIREIAGRYAYATAGGERRPLLEAEEVANLTIQRGTLNPEERKIIEQHVVTTFDLLSELPFPPALRRVPEIAGSHHERVDGNGYPKRLTREEITLQGRILGLADVFEALTARDRPYKLGRTLTETFRILDQMRDEGAIDPDLYDLFKSEKTYLPYVASYVSPVQIDGDYWEELERFTNGTEGPAV